MSKKLYSLMALLMVVSMLLAACGQGAGTTEFKACQVTDTGGIDDRSFNATAWKGIQDAEKELGVTGKYLESQNQTDYEKNINAFLDEGCDIIVTVGFLLGEATKTAALANPDQKFAIVDYCYDPNNPLCEPADPMDNVLGLAFKTDQAAFMAGYVAAATTKTGTVGSFGGMQIPTVTIFMEGFARGVQYYNEQNGTSVKALGWEPGATSGLFTGNFESTDDGRNFGQSLMDEGADIVMPVAGPVGVGTAAAVKERGNAYLIGVDTDWTVSAADYADITLTSVLKNMDVAVFDAIKAAKDGTFKGGTYTGTLENNGVGLAPFHNLDSAVPAAAKGALEDLKAKIISGEVKVSP